MTVKVLVVDDSGFFRRRLTDIINASRDLKVVGTASNGREAVEAAQKLRPDVITMDYEMPVMDGITAVRTIMASNPTPILMFSSLTYEGARVTLDSLEAGAVDFLPKNFEEISKNSAVLRQKLCASILSVARSRPGAAPAAEAPAPAPAERAPAPRPSATPAPRPVAKPAAPAPSAAPVQATTGKPKKPGHAVKLVAIGTSTGGPVALQKVLTALPGNYPYPILLVQHMPGSFTPAFAERLNSMCQIGVKEAADGDMLKPGVALLAPGGKQMMVGPRGQIKVLEGDSRLNYKPSVDVTFGSAANVFGNGVLAVVMTGMGADGKEGARMLKDRGATVWAQDEASCVIYGMPMAVARANLADAIVSLQDIGPSLRDVGS